QVRRGRVGRSRTVACSDETRETRTGPAQHVQCGPIRGRNLTATVTASKPQAFVDQQRFLDCVHCGLCLSACPTYLETGKEMDSPRGRIYLLKAVQEGRLALHDPVVEHIDLCLGCRACEAACPSGVQYGELLEHGRDFIERKYKRGFFQWWLRHVFIEV